MRTKIHTPIFNIEPKYRILRILAMLKIMVSWMRKIPKLEDSQRDQEPPNAPQWGILVVHNMQCPEFTRFESGVEFIPVDLEKIPRFLQVLAKPPLEHGSELDWSERNNLQACDGIQSPSAFDCRYYLEQVVIQSVDQSMVEGSGLQSTYAYTENDWPSGTRYKLPRQVFFEEGPVGSDQASILGWIDTVTDVSMEQLFEGKEQDISIAWLQAATDKIWFPNVL